jgi:hypothetical protein
MRTVLQGVRALYVPPPRLRCDLFWSSSCLFLPCLWIELVNELRKAWLRRHENATGLYFLALPVRRSASEVREDLTSS